MGKIVGLTFPAEAAYTCPHCGRSYKSEETMMKHLRDKHGEPTAAPGTAPDTEAGE